MKRVLNLLLGLVFVPIGTALGFGGALRFYKAATYLTEANVSPEVSSAALGQMLIGLLVAGVGFAGAGSGLSRLKRAWRGEAAAPQPATLTLTYAGQPVTLVPGGGEVMIGRGADCQVMVDSKYVSRNHARVEWGDAAGAPRLVNLSQWGTSVRARGESVFRGCDPELALTGEGDIALSYDGPAAESAGDMVRFNLSEPASAAAKPGSKAGTYSTAIKVALGLALLVGIAIYEFGAGKGANEAKRAEMNTAMQEVRKSAESALQQGAGTGPVAAPPGSVTPVAKGDAGKLEAALKKVLNRGLAQRREYELELQAIGWGTVLDAARLQKDANFAESRNMLRQAHAIVARHRDGIDAHFAQMRKEIEQADLRPEDKRAVLQGVDEALPAQKVQSAENWSLEELALTQFDKIFALLESKRKAWKVQNGKITFNNQSDLDQFRSYLAAIDRVTARQEEMRKSAEARARESLKSMK